MGRRILAGLLASALLTVTPGAQAPDGAVVRVYAAGSLMAPLNAIAAALKQQRGITLALTFGPSGTLRERLERGEPADLFTSANMAHPQALTRAQRSGPTVQFTRNALCALSRADVGLSAANLLDRLLDPAVTVATSTPIADPAGDYAWELFRKADALRPGAFATLEAKARQLSGGAVVAPPPPAVPRGRNAAAFYLENRTADVYLYYCTGVAAAMQDSPALVSLALPASLAVGADYGMTMMNHAVPAARAVMDFILSPAGQRLFADTGFQPIGVAEGIQPRR